MLNNPYTEDSDKDILERLRHPELEGERRKMSRNLFMRNILNSVFILLAIIAMVGIVVSAKGERSKMLWYGLGLYAVIIKMVEVVLRMPGIKK